MNALEKLPSSPQRKNDDENWARGTPLRSRGQTLASEQSVCPGSSSWLLLAMRALKVESMQVHWALARLKSEFWACCAR